MIKPLLYITIYFENLIFLHSSKVTFFNFKLLKGMSGREKGGYIIIVSFQIIFMLFRKNIIVKKSTPKVFPKMI